MFLAKLNIQLRKICFGASVPFFLLHIAVLGIFFFPFHWKYVALAAATYLIRMFGVTAGYHRYFSHRSYKLARIPQFLMAFLAQTSSQKGVLWWAAHHRDHHQHSDQETDIHSPRQDGFWWAHVGWIISSEYDTYDPARIRDFGKFPELRWLDRYHWVPTAVFGAAIFFIFGLPAFFWGYVFSTVVLFHCTFTINSLSHVWGSRRFATPDDSRNNFFLALLTLGEGWHNNHHQFMYAVRQGIYWWEVDITYYVLKMLSWVGIVREMREIRLPYEQALEKAA